MKMHTRFQATALVALSMLLAGSASLSADAGSTVEGADAVLTNSAQKQSECEPRTVRKAKPRACAPKTCEPETCKPKKCVPKIYKAITCEPGINEEMVGDYLSECKREPNVLFTADFLWWATNYGLPVSIIITGNQDDTLTYGRVLRTHTKFSPGVRLGLGGNLDYDGWDLQAFWTYYYNTENRSIPSGIGQFRSTKISSYPQLRLTYNTADLELGATHGISRHLAFRPFAGVRGAWLYQLHHQRIDHAGESNSNIPLKIVEDIWAVGPRMGLNMIWDCKKGFHILANMSGSLLYGVSKGQLAGVLPVDSSVVGIDLGHNVHIKDKDTELFASFQTFLGLDWERTFNCGKNSFKIAAGWESNYWAAYNLLLVFNPSISFQGLTVDMVLGF